MDLVSHHLESHHLLTQSLLTSCEDVIFHIGSTIELVVSQILFDFQFPRFETFRFSHAQPWLPSLLLQIQLSRRLLESMFLARHDNSKMHVAHLVFALCYYPAISLSLNISCQPASTVMSTGAVLLFVWASLHQFKCHKILADLRKENKGVYGIPRGDWFNFVSSPHYFAEFLIYIALFMASGWGYFLGLNCLYQILNFSLICTPPTHDWYLKKFEHYPKTRKIFIPFIY